jgi:hypothetical protein
MVSRSKRSLPGGNGQVTDKTSSNGKSPQIAAFGAIAETTADAQRVTEVHSAVMAAFTVAAKLRYEFCGIFNACDWDERSDGFLSCRFQAGQVDRFRESAEILISGLAVLEALISDAQSAMPLRTLNFFIAGRFNSPKPGAAGVEIVVNGVPRSCFHAAALNIADEFANYVACHVIHEYLASMEFEDFKKLHTALFDTGAGPAAFTDLYSPGWVTVELEREAAAAVGALLPSACRVPADPDGGEAFGTEGIIRGILAQAGCRLTTSQILKALSVQFPEKAPDDGTVKRTLAAMVRYRHLTNSRDAKPPGYGLPDWK